MTRINCIPVQELTDKHLGAEYRELPRVFMLSMAAFKRGEDCATHPQTYTLGKGHVKFFYSRLEYLRQRYTELVIECQRRGRKVNFPNTPDVNVPIYWNQNWVPTQEAQAINRMRIAERLSKQ